MADRRTDDTPLAPRRSLAGSRDGQTRTTDEKQTRTPEEKQQRPNNNDRKPNERQSGSPQSGSPQSGSPQSGSSQSGPSQSGAQKPGTQQSNVQRSGQSGSQQSTRTDGGKGGTGTTTEAPRKPMTDRVSEKVSGAVTAATETVRKARESRPEQRPQTSTASRPAKPAGSQTRPRSRKARLRLTHVDPWSVMKIAFLLSIAIGIVTVIAVAMVWSVLGAAGVWDSINRTVQEVIGGQDGSAFDVENYIGASRVLGFTMIVAVVDVVLITAIATLGAFLYNLAATLLGGLEVTLAEEEH